MFYVLQNESTAARRRVPILLTDAATGTTAQSGVALTTIFPYVNINGGAFIGGTGSVGEAGFGQYYYEMAAGETNTLGLAGIHITAAGCRDYDAITQVAALNLYSPSAGVGATAGDIWSYVLSNASSADSNLVAAAAGGGVTSGDIWNYVFSNADTAEANIVNTKNNTDTIVSQTAPTQIRDAVWDTDISFLNPSNQAGGILYMAAMGLTANAPDQVWNYATRTLTSGAGATAGDVWSYVSRTLTGTVSIDAGSVGDIWNYTLPDSNTAAQDLVTAATGGAGISAADVWNYATRTITGGLADTVTTLTDRSGFAITGGTITTVLDKTGYSLSGTQSFNLTGNITGSLSGSVGSVSGNVGGNVVGSVASVSGNVGGNVVGNVNGNVVGSVASVTNPVTVTNGTYASIASSVWNSPVASYSTNGTFGLNILRADQANKVGDVTLYSSGGVNGVDADVHRIANDNAAATVLKEVLTGIGGSITANITGNVSGSVNSVTQPVSLSAATQASIANSVWLTDVSGYTAPSAGEDLATAGAGGISPADVWTYASRTITGGLADTVTTLTNRSGFAITGGTITTVSDKTGYSLSASQTFDLTGNITGNLSGSVGSVSGSVGSVTGSVGSVTGNVGGSVASVSGNVGGNVSGSVGSVAGNVSGNVVGSVASVSNPVSITTASMGSIGSTVWNYILSDTQTADANLVAAGGGGVAITAGDVWSYATRTLTSGSGITVIGAVQLVNGPYRLTSNQNNNDGVLDILQNSVQEINLNLIDGNGAPASTAGYGVAVNFFNEAGTAVTTYVPTVEYADGGVLTFEIDTAVTGTIGRYNLIVNLSGAGFVVKYGPLTTLVRPL